MWVPRGRAFQAEGRNNEGKGLEVGIYLVIQGTRRLLCLVKREGGERLVVCGISINHIEPLAIVPLIEVGAIR